MKVINYLKMMLKTEAEYSSIQLCFLIQPGNAYKSVPHDKKMRFI